MKRLLLTAFLLPGLSATAQCIFMIQPTFTKVTSDTTINVASGDYWVCLGKTLTVNNSAGSTYYMEDFSVLNVLSTTGDQAILKPGCTVNNSSSGDVAVTADMASITLNNTGSGTITQQTDCPPGNGIDPFAPGVTFGYGAGPFYSLCFAVPLGVENAEEQNSLIVYPNPAEGDALFFDPDAAVAHAAITDIRGKTVRTFSQPENKLAIDGLAGGTYLLHATLENGSLQTVRFSVR